MEKLSSLINSMSINMKKIRDNSARNKTIASHKHIPDELSGQLGIVTLLQGSSSGGVAVRGGDVGTDPQDGAGTK